jgi:hypothetical protein
MRLQKYTFYTKCIFFSIGNKYWKSLKHWFETNGQDFPSKYVSLMSEDLDEILSFIKNTVIDSRED